MKTQLSLALAVTLTTNFVHGQAQEDYVNWIRQIQTERTSDGGSFEVVQDITVSTRGSAISPLSIPEGGAIFQLWTMNSITQESWLLDTDVVGTTRPHALIHVETVDSHAGVARTRVDQPYSIAIDYLQLQEAGEGVDEALTQVRSFHFTEGATSAEGGELAILSKGYDRVVHENRRDKQSNIYTQIPVHEGGDPLKVQGVENYVVEMLTGAEDEVVLSSERIEVYPVPDGELKGIERESIAVLPTELEIKVNDAYPGSRIYLRVNVQPEGAPANDDWFEVLSKNISTENSQDLEVKFSEWEIVGEEYGTIGHGDRITFDLVSETNFANGETLIEILSESSTVLDNKLVLRGSVNTLTN